jgi:competence protein ComEA
MQREDKKLVFVLLVFFVSAVVAILIYSRINMEADTDVVFYTGTTSMQTISQASSSEASAPLIVRDINKVTAEQLMLIDGIGEKTAASIIDYRSSIGGFGSLEQLFEVDGIGSKIYERLSAWLYISDEDLSQTTVTIALTQAITESQVSESIVVTTVPAAASESQTTTVTVTTTQAVTTILYPIDINFATKEELMSLSGIGEVKAEGIISYREQESYFYSAYEITNVSGIGDTIFYNICDYIYVDISLLPPRITTMTEAELLISTTATPLTTAQTTVTTPYYVNINTATKEMLTAYLGLTDEEAEAIILHRSHEGCEFVDPLELLLFLSSSTYNRIADRVCVS